MSDHESNGSRPFREVLDAALVELWAREKRLVAFETELKEVRRAIAVLEKAMGGGGSERAASRNGSAPRQAGETRAKIIAALQKAGESMDAQEIAEAIGEKPAGWLSMTITRMARDGAIASYAAGRYGPPVAKRPGPLEAAVLDAAGIEQG